MIKQTYKKERLKEQDFYRNINVNISYNEWKITQMSNLQKQSVNNPSVISTCLKYLIVLNLHINATNKSTILFSQCWAALVQL